jgi:hypothetical protein
MKLDSTGNQGSAKTVYFQLQVCDSNTRDCPQIWNKDLLVTSIQIGPVYASQQIGDIHRPVLDIKFETNSFVKFPYKYFVVCLLAFLRNLRSVDRIA